VLPSLLVQFDVHGCWCQALGGCGECGGAGDVLRLKDNQGLAVEGVAIISLERLVAGLAAIVHRGDALPSRLNCTRLSACGTRTPLASRMLTGINDRSLPSASMVQWSGMSSIWAGAPAVCTVRVSMSHIICAPFRKIADVKSAITDQEGCRSGRTGRSRTWLCALRTGVGRRPSQMILTFALYE